MKLISDWLLDAPEEWRDEAIVNWMAQIMWPLEEDLCFEEEDDVASSLASAIDICFKWDTTSQGYNYWLKKSNSA